MKRNLFVVAALCMLSACSSDEPGSGVEFAAKRLNLSTQE